MLIAPRSRPVVAMRHAPSTTFMHYAFIKKTPEGPVRISDSTNLLEWWLHALVKTPEIFSYVIQNELGYYPSPKGVWVRVKPVSIAILIALIIFTIW